MNLYTINYSKFYADLCRLEMKSLFGLTNPGKYFFSDRLIAPSRSPFIKERLTVIFEGDTMESLVEQVLDAGFAAERFRVTYLKVDDGTEGYQERLQSGRDLGTAIRGEADIRHPQVTFGVTRVNGKWLFGPYEKNDYSWHHHDKKPHTYSNSLNFRVARALVNIAVGPDTTRTLVDPCCGIGTVIIEALSMGIDARGYDINPFVANNARRNLAFFSFPDVIKAGDMHSVHDRYDVAAVDIPYGLYQQITPAEQLDMIKTARRICSRMILVSFDNMDEMIREAGFTLTDKARVPKGKFVRFINVCE
jgi:tRNA G10  N-methylase Trm11